MRMSSAGVGALCLYEQDKQKYKHECFNYCMDV